MTTIAIFFTNYGPYHLARFTSFQRYCRCLGWKVIGIELSRSDIDYNWETKLEDLSNSIVSVIEDRQFKQVKFTDLLTRLFTVMSKINPDVIAIAGYAESGMLSALVWSCLHRRPVILLSASKEDDATRSWWQEKIKSFLIKQYTAALVGGKPQKRYLLKLGMPDKSIFEGYNVVGNDNFHPQKISTLAAPHAQPYFLAINRFIPKKNLHNLIYAYAAYRQQAKTDAWDLILCGDGELRHKIEQQIAQLGLQDVVHLTGFLQQNELLPYLAAAGCFVHTSIQEQWGLVVNEAMAAGLPVLVSNRCGCFEDLVIEGVNGFGFDPENTTQLADLMLKISSPECDRTKMGQAALEHIQKFSSDYFAQSLTQAVKYALANA